MRRCQLSAVMAFPRLPKAGLALFMASPLIPPQRSAGVGLTARRWSPCEIAGQSLTKRAI